MGRSDETGADGGKLQRSDTDGRTIHSPTKLEIRFKFIQTQKQLIAVVYKTPLQSMEMLSLRDGASFEPWSTVWFGLGFLDPFFLTKHCSYRASIWMATFRKGMGQ